MASDSDLDRLTDDQWVRLAPLMPGGCKGKRGPRTNNRLFMDAILWMARSGARWRDLPERFGDYRIVKRRYYDWIERGVLASLLKALSDEADFEWVSIDATVVRADQHAAGARRKKGGLMPRGWAARAAA
jgi:transposase